MVDLSTKYMGLQLENPLIVGSSSLTNTVPKVKRMAEAGAGAVVLKSLFEEQILAEKVSLEKHTIPSQHPETYEYIDKLSMELGPDSYLKLIEESKRQISIPVIASLNCISVRWWTDYARKIENAGADALELNISFLPSDLDTKSEEVEKKYIEIFTEVKDHVDIPIAVKIGPYFTSPGTLIKSLSEKGASAVVLFNRFYQFDINIHKLEVSSGMRFSSSQEMNNSMRWISLLFGRISADIAASTGIYETNDVIKQILSGADVVELVSTLYVNGPDHINNILDEIRKWMAEHSFNSVEKFRGLLSREQSDTPEDFERLQYIKAVVGVE